MNKRQILVYLLFGVLFACKRPAADEVIVEAKVPVTIVPLTYGTVDDDLTLFASTLYLKRNVVTSPIPAFITQVYIKLGDRVKEGQIIYAMETKERRAIGSQQIAADSSLSTFGKIIVRAPASGIVTTLDKQQIGDYVLEGTQLCTIAESDALAFSVNVPFEFITLAKTGMKCLLVLPDSAVYPGRFTTPLTTMNALAQTQTILAKSDKNMFLPENLIVKVLVNRSAGYPHQLLPRTCVLSDEMLKDFWVMKLVNDSTAVKIPVSLGNKNHLHVEILKPEFKSTDQFLRSGNYGLPDTARVSINKN